MKVYSAKKRKPLLLVLRLLTWLYVSIAISPYSLSRTLSEQGADHSKKIEEVNTGKNHFLHEQLSSFFPKLTGIVWGMGEQQAEFVCVSNLASSP